MMTYKQIAAFGIAASLLGASIIGLQLGQKDATAGMEFQNRLIVSPKNVGKTMKVRTGVNKTLLIELPQNATDVVVANPNIADAIMRTPRRAYVLAQDTGQTNLMFFNKEGNPISIVDVTIDTDTGPLQDMLNTMLPAANITVETLKGSVILKGQVKSAADAARAVKIAEQFAEERESVTQTTSMSGSANDIDFSSRVINMLSVAGKDQVMIKVTVAEVERQVIKNLGINLDAISNVDNFSFGAFTNVVNRLKQVGSAATEIGTAYNSGNTSASSAIEALDEQGLVKIFAEPTLVAISGEKAEFKAGGEVPVVIDRDISLDTETGTVGLQHEIKWVDMGIELSFVPVVLPGNRINLQIAVQSSELSPYDNLTFEENRLLDVSVNELNMKSIRKRETKTTVELPSGGSLAIAGMMQERDQNILSQTPGLANLPIVGGLFRSRAYQNNQSELMIIATAYIVEPVKEQELTRPTDGIYTASDLETTLFGRLAKVYGTENVSAPTATAMPLDMSQYSKEKTGSIPAQTPNMPQQAPMQLQSGRSVRWNR